LPFNLDFPKLDFPELSGQAVPSITTDSAAMATHAAQAAALLKSLAHPARLRVLCRLVEGEAPVQELLTVTGLSASALSQHLAVLRTLDVVVTRRQAQTLHYRLLDGPALGVLQALHAAYCVPQR
jgi:DNA-binding transcriptional ArsR family regulator